MGTGSEVCCHDRKRWRHVHRRFWSTILRRTEHVFPYSQSLWTQCGVVFSFNWISPNPSCATTANSTNGSYDEINGSQLRASNGGSDFALFELNSTPPASYGIVYAGWDKSDATTVTETTGIHHPSGDIMKICRDNDAPYHSTSGGAQVWWIDEWEEGVTEPGSSGSPLFDRITELSASCMVAQLLVQEHPITVSMIFTGDSVFLGTDPIRRID